MADICYPVQIGTGAAAKTYDWAYQVDPANADDWKAVLQNAHRQDHVRCLCPGSGDRKLAVRYMSGSDSYHLSRYPRSGAEHAKDCQHYSEAPQNSGLGAYSVGVVTETDDGTFRVKLTLSLVSKKAADTPVQTTNTPSVSGASTSQPAMTLGGLLHFLWNEARLNRWSSQYSDARTLNFVGTRLLQAAEQVYASRICIGKALLVSTKTKATVDANETIVADAAKHHRRLIAIGKLESYDSAKQQLKLQCPFGMPFFKVTPDIWERTIKSYRKAIGAHEKGYSVVAILQTDKPVVGKKCTTANVLNVALMIVSDEWIPVESGYELFIERMLRAQKRSFIKPMRFDCKVNPVFPDFWLTDSVSGGHIPMEVYGLDDPKYLARKAAKAVIYNTKYTPAGWWHWNAYLDKKCAAIPPFPL